MIPEELNLARITRGFGTSRGSRERRRKLHGGACDVTVCFAHYA